MKTITLGTILGLLMAAVNTVQAQDKVGIAYCQHGESGAVIAIRANMACPFGYWRI